MQTQSYAPAPPLIDLTVIDADLKPTDHPGIQSIHVWYEGLTPDMAQVEACGYDFLNYLQTVLGRTYVSVMDYWYSVHPYARNKEVEEYLEYRANNPQQYQA